MNKLLKYVVLSAICLTVISCKESPYMLYYGGDYLQMVGIQDIEYNFCFETSDVTRDTVIVTVQAMGNPKPYDRRFNFKQITQYYRKFSYDQKGNIVDTTFVERENRAEVGVHFVSWEDPALEHLLTLPANEVYAEVPITLLRDPSLQDKAYYIRLEVIPTTDFMVGDENAISRSIVVTDMLQQPSNWNQYYLGTYSRRKHQFMIDLTGEKIDYDWISMFRATQASIKAYLDAFNAALLKYNNDPENIAQGLSPMKDENNIVITFPTR